MDGEIVTLSNWLALLTSQMVNVVVEADHTIVFTVGANRIGMEEARQLVASAAFHNPSPQPQTFVACNE